MNWRGWLYRVAKYGGDAQAVRRGTTGRRAARRGTGTTTGRLFGKLFRGWK